MGPKGFTKVTDLQNGEGKSWGKMEDLRGTRRSYHRVGEDTMQALLVFASSFDDTTTRQLEDCDMTFRDFELSTRQIKKLVPPPEPNFQTWNRCWDIFEPNLVWKARCRKVRMGFTHSHSRFVVWRFLSHAYYSNSRGALWGINATCPICLVAPETPNHMFFECRRARLRWARIQAKTRGTRFDFSHCFTLLEVAICH